MLYADDGRKGQFGLELAIGKECGRPKWSEK
jgi:hypothetical protein